MQVLWATLLLATAAVTLTSALPAGHENNQLPEAQEAWRLRRSPDDRDNKSPGGYSVDIYEQDKVGVVGKVQGHGNVWRSDDGRSRVDAHGEWSKVLDGPQRGKPTHNAGVSFSHDFGDD